MAKPVNSSHNSTVDDIEVARGYLVRAKGEKSAEILLYDEIGDGWFGGVSAKQFAKDLREIGAVDHLSIRINSPGGNVFDGNTIYNLLRDHKAHKVVHIDGLAASIASVIAMAGNEIHIAENAMMMIHPASAFVIGNADDMRKTAEMLDKLDDSIAGTYVKRTNLDEAKIKQLMSEETWMSAQEALDYGFVDEITDVKQVAAYFDLSKFQYHHPPQVLVAASKNDFRSELARMNLASQKIRIASNPKK